jgi:predicted RNA-binding protein
MCESNAYLIEGEGEKVIMESVDILRPEDDGIYLENIFGEHLKIKARIKEMNLVDHRILLVKEEGTVKNNEVDNNLSV